MPKYPTVPPLDEIIEMVREGLALTSEEQNALVDEIERLRNEQAVWAETGGPC